MRPLLPLHAGIVALALVTLGAGAAESRRNGSGSKSAAKAAAAPAAANTGPKTIESFQLVMERNIFNSNRVGRTRPSGEEKTVKVDQAALVGTLQFDGEKLAIFDSPDSTYRKSVREGEALGEFKVQSIAADGVELTREGKTVALKVAQQLRRTEGADWSVAANPAVRAVTDAPGTVRPPTVELPANASEVLKRLMKNREKQLK